jgi:[NiFe] hydrogenase assembly HybE family chaperone
MSNPGNHLQDIFKNIAATRMAGVPILNPAMHVEAIGFREWEGHWIGVLVTPWMINLVLMSGEEMPLTPLLQGEKQTWRFPSGAYEFMGLNEPELGACHICPLISPVAEFATHEEAVAVAREMVEFLFMQTTSDRIRDVELTDDLEKARLNGESLAKRDLSRRDFLRLPFLGR